jgi:HPt (histidine-containing phosphotransfer) domain-containing protein
MEVPMDLMNRYLQRRKQDLECCFTYLRRSNFGALEKVGHQLKGNAETFGHPELSCIGRKLERAASDRDLKQLQQAVQDFSKWVSKQVSV